MNGKPKYAFNTKAFLSKIGSGRMTEPCQEIINRRPKPDR